MMQEPEANRKKALPSIKMWYNVLAYKECARDKLCDHTATCRCKVLTLE